ncbi:alpha/beta fold hydrolase [Nostocoides sp. F2B08]|nr:alpha/beta fold hydrolase [Tetrasphaera sp. F2B08]
MNGSGPPVVVVDPAGAFSGMRPLADVVDALSTRFTVLTYDRRGRGRSTDTAPYAVEREVEDIAAVTELAAEPSMLFGFSSGAALALHAAAGHVSLKRLVLLEPAVDLDGPPDTAFTAELDRLVRAGRRAEAVEFFNRAIGVPEEWIDGLRAHPAWDGLQALAHTLLYDASVTESVTRQVLARVEVPTLVLVSEGSGSPLREWSEAVAAAVPRSTVRHLHGDWHRVDSETLTSVIISTG